MQYIKQKHRVKILKREEIIPRISTLQYIKHLAQSTDLQRKELTPFIQHQGTVLE